MFLLLIAGLLFSAPSFATEADSQTSNVSDANSRVWVDLNLGFAGTPVTGLSGLDTNGGLGAIANLDLRYRVGRCGPMVNVRYEYVYYPDPVRTDNFLYGAGVFCRVVSMGTKYRRTKGTHVDVHGLFEYGRSDYGFADGEYYRAHNSTAYSGAGAVGGDIFFPAFSGFWFHGGLDLELNNFSYSTNSAVDGTPVRSSSMTPILSLHLGMSYAFL